MSDRSVSSRAAASTLYVVATPIGNLGDLSTRARDILATATVIAAEDTRHTRQLLQAFAIETPLTALHEHSEASRIEALLERLVAGDSIALVSDAGTPLISDPGFDLVAAARARGLAVVTVPGPSAVIAALSIAGLPTDRFVFEGFLPAKTAARRTRLASLASDTRTLVCYEAPHRLAEVLTDIADVFGGERRVVVCRELTKRFETTYDATARELATRVATDADMSRGELVIVMAGAPPQEKSGLALDADTLLRALLEDLAPSQAARIAARIAGVNRGELYDRALALTGKTV
jgi:16S rRNA (cytidine1402-2'-O)-methyltransferase